MVSVFTGCEFAFNGLKGNGIVVEKQFEVSDFKSVDVGDNFDVYLEKGNQPGVRIVADENFMQQIRVYNRGEALTIEARRNFYDASSLKVYITYVEMSSLNVSGSADLQASKSIIADSFTVHVSGGARADLNIEAGQLTSNVSGGATIRLTFKGDEIRSEGSGGSGGRIKISDGVTGKFNVSGGSAFTVEGICANAKIECSGGSGFKGKGLVVQTADVSTSGASTANLNVEHELSISASGASSVSILGNPRVVHKEISSAASFRMQ